MGEYAEMAMERDWESQFQPYEDFYDIPNYVVHSTSSRHKWKDEGMPYEDRVLNTPILLRQFKRNLYDLKINSVCLVIRQTEKAVLFKVDKTYEEDAREEITFWLPKSVLYRRENELSVVYVKNWATIKGSEVLEELC